MDTLNVNFLKELMHINVCFRNHNQKYLKDFYMKLHIATSYGFHVDIFVSIANI